MDYDAFSTSIRQGVDELTLISMNIVIACWPTAALYLGSKCQAGRSRWIAILCQRARILLNCAIFSKNFPCRPTALAAAGRAGGASPAGMLLLLLGPWAASWAALVSLSSWLR